jgi:hypothetical protein
MNTRSIHDVAWRMTETVLRKLSESATAEGRFRIVYPLLKEELERFVEYQEREQIRLGIPKNARENNAEECAP